MSQRRLSTNFSRQNSTRLPTASLGQVEKTEKKERKDKSGKEEKELPKSEKKLTDVKISYRFPDTNHATSDYVNKTSFDIRNMSYDELRYVFGPILGILVECDKTLVCYLTPIEFAKSNYKFKLYTAKYKDLAKVVSSFFPFTA